jgi:TRAP-type C4-dicarboxylate transport system substrate-binding protein
MRRSALTLGIVAIVSAVSGARAEETLKVVAAWGPNTVYTQNILSWTKELNDSAEAKGVLRIQFIGGPEITAASEQYTALRKGVYDIHYGAAGYYLGQVPEGYVFYGANVTPIEARKNGGIDLLASIWQKKANAHVLGWVAAGVGYNIWLLKEPKLKADGTPDLAGLKIRSSPLYNVWISSMGGTNVPVPVPEIYSALQRNVVDGMAFPALGVTDFGAEKLLKLRIEPPVWQFDNLLIVNLEKWNKLDTKAQGVLQASVVRLEETSIKYFTDLDIEERKKVAAAGVKDFPIAGAARTKYVADARAIQWEQIKKSAPEHYDALRAKFYK